MVLESINVNEDRHERESNQYLNNVNGKYKPKINIHTDDQTGTCAPTDGRKSSSHRYASCMHVKMNMKINGLI